MRRGRESCAVRSLTFNLLKMTRRKGTIRDLVESLCRKKCRERARGAQKAAKSAQKRSKRTQISDDACVNDDVTKRNDQAWDPSVDSTVKKKSSARERLEKIRRNVLEVLKNSNIMPFRWLKSSYRCFYCYDIFEDPGELKNHQRVHAGDEVKEKAMNNYWENVVYVDVSNISCSLCPEPMVELYELIDHLISRHGVVYDKDVGACMYPFKLESLSVACLVCGANFRTFGPLLTHTNKNHKGCSSILCDACGQHFKYSQLLKEHIKSVHQNCTVLCTKCGVSFDTKNKLRTHEQRSHGRKFKCLVCPEMFPSHYKRSQHMAEEHKNRSQVKCLYCPKKFVFRSMMMSHLRDTHLKEKNHVCGVCGWRAFSVNRLKNHMYKHSGEKQFKCTVCEKAFTTKKIMKAHSARMHKNNQPTYDGVEERPTDKCSKQESIGNPPADSKKSLRELLLDILQCSTAMPFRRYGNKYRCFYCDRSFYYASELREHTGGDHGNPDFTRALVKNITDASPVKIDVTNLNCKLCPRAVDNVEELVQHMNEYHSKKCNKDVMHCLLLFKLADDKFSCLMCDQEFQFFGPLLLHTHRVHKNRRFICEICGQSFSSNGSIMRHTQSVHATESYQCRHCDKKFYALYRRDNHERRIHDLSKLKCHVCSEILGSEYKRDTHLATVHDVWTAEFKCAKCQKVFRFRNQLVNHDKRVHLKEKNITCDLCGDKFFDRHLLKLHMVRHSNTKPFHCDLCKKSFPRKRALEIHTRIHTNDRRCVCKECGKAFIQTASLKLHIRVHHSRTNDANNVNWESIENKVLEMDVPVILYFLPISEPGVDAAKVIEKFSEKRRKNEIATLLSCLLEFTTVMPFRWSSNKYLCFYCCSNFTSSQKLRDHTKGEHDRAKLKNVLKNISGRSSVKIDISELACKLCRIEMDDLDSVIDHMVSDHDAKYDRTVKHYLVPFKLSDEEMGCLECEKTYRFYGTLLAHVYKVHIRTKSFICEICGQGFTFKLNMDSHMKWTHLNNEWRCESCDKCFPSYYAKRNHHHAVHRTEKLKCPKCPEVLRSAYLKKQHLALVHDVKSVQFRCDLCPKVFTLKNKLSSHRRRVHLNEKSVTCEICGFRVFNNENLKRHMVKHDDARPFECEYCKKAFQRKKTLEFHRRIHTNDRRYVCKECGRAFVQTTSLKLHVRVHHSRGND
ncbi:Zinc finger protein 208 [Eumeta japonica]|uniref:Zinc finger protein 208 n=1 Tax=Eumeta variegata TaxID=151549 RepID=A0A4C1VY70_EUMVA|nr:Zinc finger protein 208 [Eumeta japonica]